MTTATAPAATRTTWEIDTAHSAAHFAVRHMMVANVRGEFGKVSGTVVLDRADLDRSDVRATIDVASLSTREPQRDAHLKSADFFDLEKYPTIEFQSTVISATGDGEYAMTGDLTIHGVTRPVTLKVEASDQELKDPYGNIKRGATATTKINRKDFGLGWNVALEAGGIMVGDEVKITLDVELLMK